MKTYKQFLLETKSRSNRGSAEGLSSKTPEAKPKKVTTFEIGRNENLAALFNHLQEIRKRPVKLTVRIQSRDQ